MIAVPTLFLVFVLNKLTPFCSTLGLETLFQAALRLPRHSPRTTPGPAQMLTHSGRVSGGEKVKNDIYGSRELTRPQALSVCVCLQAVCSEFHPRPRPGTPALRVLHSAGVFCPFGATPLKGHRCQLF